MNLEFPKWFTYKFKGSIQVGEQQRQKKGKQI